METENNSPTLGDNAELHLVEYNSNNSLGIGMFELFVTIEGNWRQIFIREDQLNSEEPYIESPDTTPMPQVIIDRLSVKWPELVIICKHERTRYKREN